MRTLARSTRERTMATLVGGAALGGRAIPIDWPEPAPEYEKKLAEAMGNRSMSG